MASLTANEADICDTVRAQIATIPLEKIVGQPTNTTVNHLEQKCAKLADSAKTTKWGGCHGCLTFVINEEEFKSINGNNTATDDHLDTPPLTPDGLTNSTTLINQKNSTRNKKSIRRSTGNSKPSTESPLTACHKTSSTQPTSRNWRTTTSATLIKPSRISSNTSATNGASSPPSNENRHLRLSVLNEISLPTSRTTPANSIETRKYAQPSMSPPATRTRRKPTSKTCTPVKCLMIER